MTDLFRTRCKAGWLVITEQAVRIERKGILGAGKLSQVLPRQALVSATSENKLPGILGQGGMTTLTFTGYGAILKAEMVNPKDAQNIMTMLGYA
jgi:hypothetical protein